MDAVAIIARIDDQWKYVTIASSEDPVSVGEMLKLNYANHDLVAELIGQGNIISLGETVSESKFDGTAYKTIEAVFNQFDDFDVADYNYVLAMNREGDRFWAMTRYGIDGFHNI